MIGQALFLLDFDQGLPFNPWYAILDSSGGGDASHTHNTSAMISNKIHALYKINKGGIKTDCVEFVEFEGSQNISVTRYQLKGSKGHFSLLPASNPEYMHRLEARKIWTSVKADGYQAIA